MDFYDLQPITMYCQNCGHKVIGYKSRDRTARFNCKRCGVVWVSRRMDNRNIDTRSTAPHGQAAFF